MRRTIAILMITAMLLGVLGSAVQAQPASAVSPAVTLSTSGWSLPVGDWDPGTGTAVLQQDVAGLTIVSTGLAKLTVQGGSGKVSGAGKGYGVTIDKSSGVPVKVKGLTIQGFARGISVSASNSITLEGNSISGCGYGIHITGSPGTTLTGNSVSSSTYYGIFVNASGGSTLAGNTANGNGDDGIRLVLSGNSTLTGNACASNGDCGLYIDQSGGNTLTHNALSANGAGFRLDGRSDSQYTQTIDKSNTVNGKPILYLVGASGGTYGSETNAGVVFLVNCSGVTVHDLDLSGNQVGVLLWNTSGSRLQKIKVSGTGTGIWLRNSGTNASSNNPAGNELVENDVTGNSYAGIYLEASNGNTLQGNAMRTNGQGLYLYGASSNRVYGNKFYFNTAGKQAVVSDGSGNVFNLDKPKGGNYWSDWTGPDVDPVDGFVDSPKTFTTGSDLWPLVSPDPPKADTTPPVTTAVLTGTPGAGGWYRSSVTVALLASDEGGSGVAKTEYSLDGASWLTYSAPFSIDKEGITSLVYFSTDKAGNAEKAGPQPPQEVKIDKAAPTLIWPAPGEVLPSGTALSFGARDAVSGLAGVKGSLYDGLSKQTIVTIAVSSDQLKGAKEWTTKQPVNPGVYELTLKADDVAGNTTGDQQPSTFIVPSAEGAKVTGGGWFGTSGGKGAQGKAFINVVCQSRKAPAAPTGQFSFRADALGNLGEVNLKGTSYRWLVVRDGLAWLEGMGTLNGKGNYRFQVVVQGRKTASEPDRVRVMIWDQKGNSVYDTQQGNATAAPTGTLSDGGNIAVHKG